MWSAEEDSMLTQASSLVGPPLNGRETRRIYERGEEKGREQTWLDAMVSLRPGGPAG